MNPWISTAGIVARVHGVTRYFDSPAFVRALTEVSFEVHHGEVFGLLGPRGSGKSTLLRILAGRLSPSEGKGRVFGRACRRRAVRSRIGYLPQEPAHERSQLVHEAVDFARDLFGHKPRKTVPQDLPAEVGSINRLWLLKQVLSRRPELLLLDDPFAGLDQPACAELREILRSLVDRGRTVILTGRSIIEAKDVCTRVALLARGRLEAIGTLEELLSTPKALPYLADLVPAATAQRLLDTIRHDLEASALPGQESAELLPDLHAETEHSTLEPANGAVLAPLLKAPTLPVSRTTETKPPVNDALLAALTKGGQEPPPASDTPCQPEERRP